MAERLIDVLIRRDKISREEAEDLIKQAKEDLLERLVNGDMDDCFEICQDWFGLEPDFLEDLID